MGENINSWSKNFPRWISQLLWVANLNPELFPFDQTRALTMSFRKYVLNKYWKAFNAFCMLVGLPNVQKILLADEQIYNILKKAFNKKEISALVFMNLTNASGDWQLKILKDVPFILDLLTLNDSDTVWGLLSNIAQHPDAKTLLPSEVLEAASNDPSASCRTICALLTNDDDLTKLNLDMDWIETLVKLLQTLVRTGEAQDASCGYNILDLVLPIANLSVPEAFKETLGAKAVEVLLQLLTENLPKTSYVQHFLLRGKQEASRALWNFAYRESNRKLIAAANGIPKLKSALAQTFDPILQQNICGILHMFNPAHPHPTSEQSNPSQQKHVMISYNWANQPTVIRLASALKQRGYDVWLDVEQMNGSTLEAMAHAIEQSELVLICMSQKYKDSPNCRLEGEYCVNSKIKFLPLMMQPNYKPDGWLGITLGAKLYYDFTDENNWDTKIDQLVKAMGNLGRAREPSVQKAKASQPEKSVANWTEEDMRKWFEYERIYHHYNVFKKHKFNGATLLELKCHLGNPVFFTMCKDLGISEYGEIFRLSAAIRKL
jgi:hypothetical protein